MEDPLFDPWGPVGIPVEPGGHASLADASRPQDPASSRQKAHPTAAESLARTSPAPPPRPDVPVEQHDARARWRALAPRAVPVTRPSPRPAITAPPEPSRIEERGGALGTIVLPALEDLARRLEVARHRTRFDNRLDRASPSVRFQLLPWSGPFDARSPAGPALEISLSEDEGVVVVRFWLDPFAETPDEEHRTPAADLRRRWIDDLLLHFVRKGLQA